jgi:hypothetical protein
MFEKKYLYSNIFFINTLVAWYNIQKINTESSPVYDKGVLLVSGLSKF